ncbi:MAG: Crp/Fnr family transcriptional regulator [Candidatus Nanopelagicales bacterium]|nr:Crp/Fnr family transcriptional regulator [Candidatus Nanopelagicales bacterium]HPE12727.1 Crp/Fnr family transcriptional regulator [Actinomycetota bacterium]HPJ18694.1 Crp/Fnr family transcriptional regulator [Actinomycetota bacterium]HRV67275.1 Crp/Fnr family transcriptional regulator [Candidatus Nanopelagicales bacterium]
MAHSADDDRSDLMVLHTGRLKIFRLAPDGSEQLIRVLGPGDFTGETSVFSGRRPDDYAIALDECRLCVFRHDDLEALIKEHPEIGLRMLAAVSQRLSNAERRLNSLTSRDVESRVADYLLHLPGTWQDGAVTVTLPLAKRDVASLLDTTPESFSRALKSLARQALIVILAGRSVSITQPDQLQQLVDET